MFQSMKNMLFDADKRKYAVMAINCVNMEQAMAIISAAQEEHSPVIINISPRQMKTHGTPEIIAPMVAKMAEGVNVPVALNLDHGQEYDDVIRVIKAGFTSVMIDASACEYEENINRTRLIASIAHENGLSVEGELGHVGSAVEGDSEKLDLYTNPEQAKDFVQRTNIDCLAVAIGTAHGNYPHNMTPRLDFQRLKELKDILQMPLVLHGGSGAGEENIKRAVACGINKINVCTDLFQCGRKAMVEAAAEKLEIDYMDFQIAGQNAMKLFIKDYMRMIGSSGKYYFESSRTREFD
ncbi:MAG: class II fructose-bisphosphate aldolase [Lachnospiraceae bacterium]|nr:class II fructose-bisphosphate aldolase [Lachnospiraceae bacterium]